MVVRRPVECLQRERGVPLNHLRNLGSSGLLGLHSLAVIFGAGLVTSLSPCTLNVFPLTLGYTGAFSSGKSKTEVIGNSISFATGLATTLALLGVAASFAGKAYDQIGRGLPVRSLGGVQAYLAGLTFVLAEDASPAVLQCLLRCLGMSRLHQGSTGRGSLLLTYTTGYVARLLLAASFAGSLQPAFILQVLSMDQSNEMIGLIKPTSGSAYVEGLDIWTEMNRIYTSMGVCPQHDFPWGILTGREHLLFYGRLKNLKGSSSVQVSLIFLEVIVGHHNNTNQYSKHIKKSLYLGVEESLKSVNLFHGGVADKQAGKYSGGIKRRLSVAISLIGVY